MLLGRRGKKLVGLGVFLSFGLIVWPAVLGAQTSATHYQVEVSTQGVVSVNGAVISDVLELSDTRESMVIPIISAFDEAAADVTVTLSHTVPDPERVSHRLILSRCACQAALVSESQQEVRYRVLRLTQGAGLSLSVDFPRGSFDLPLVFQLTRGFGESSPWLLGLALLLLLASGGILGWMIWEYITLRKFSFRAAPVDRPPNTLPPTLLSLLPSGKMTDRTLVAMLLDLGRRGFLTIRIERHQFVLTLERELDLTGPGFAFGSIPQDRVPQEERAKAAAEGLTLGEKYLLSKLFVEGQRVVTHEELSTRFRRHLSSWKIGKVFAETYGLSTQAGLFIRNPHLIHLRYRALGVSLFFLGMLAFVASAFFFEDQPAMLSAWAILALVGYLITRMVRYLPLLTVTGHAEWIRWEAFEKYLTDEALIPVKQQQHFFSYLPYAIAFGRSTAWARRFGTEPVVAPGWLVTDPLPHSAVEISHELEHHLHGIATLLSRIHEHTVR